MPPCPSFLAICPESHCPLVHSDGLRWSWQTGHEKINRTSRGCLVTLLDLRRTEGVGVGVNMPKNIFGSRLEDTEGKFISHCPSTAAVNLLLKKPQLLCIRHGFVSKMASIQVLCRPSVGTWHSEQTAVSWIGRVCNWNPCLVLLKLLLALFTSFS